MKDVISWIFENAGNIFSVIATTFGVLALLNSRYDRVEYGLDDLN